MNAARMTTAEFRAFNAKRRPHKYHAVPAFRCLTCGAAANPDIVPHDCPSWLDAAPVVHRFDSRREAQHWDMLNSMAKIGLISDLKIQVPFEITEDGRKITTYYADFQYRDDHGRVVTEDVKGVETPVFRLKRKLVEARYGIKIAVVK